MRSIHLRIGKCAVKRSQEPNEEDERAVKAACAPLISAEGCVRRRSYDAPPRVHSSYCRTGVAKGAPFCGRIPLLSTHRLQLPAKSLLARPAAARPRM